MSSDGDEVGRIASAEKQLCEQAGPLLAEIIRGVEERFGVRIAELRVTMDPSNPANGWSGANCVIVDPSGYIITNEHVVRNAHKIRVMLTP